MPIKDKVGQKFGKLTVVRLSHTGAKGVAFWECRCECGGLKVVRSGALGRDVSSCGCIRKSMNGFNLVSHGKSGTGTHKIWKGIVSRCRIKSATGFANYGGRGIDVCDRWLSYDNFLADMGDRPSHAHSIDRIDCNGNYDPENCRWATRVEQNRNTRRNRLVSANGQTKCIAEWASIAGISEATIRGRLDRGWDASKAVTAAGGSVSRGLVSGTSMLITANQLTLTVSGWAETIGISVRTIRSRLRDGWTPVGAVTTKKGGNKC